MHQLSVLCAVRPGGQRRATDTQMAALGMDWGGRTILDQRTLCACRLSSQNRREREEGFPLSKDSWGMP